LKERRESEQSLTENEANHIVKILRKEELSVKETTDYLNNLIFCKVPNFEKQLKKLLEPFAQKGKATFFYFLSDKTRKLSQICVKNFDKTFFFSFAQNLMFLSRRMHTTFFLLSV
jgi:hypothetical protein